MKTMQYDNKTFWQGTDYSAIRPFKKDRVEVINWITGEVQLRNRTAPKWLLKVLHDQFKKEGLTW
jgi:hypothetical protein